MELSLFSRAARLTGLLVLLSVIGFAAQPLSASARGIDDVYAGINAPEDLWHGVPTLLDPARGWHPYEEMERGWTRPDEFARGRPSQLDIARGWTPHMRIARGIPAATRLEKA